MMFNGLSKIKLERKWLVVVVGFYGCFLYSGCLVYSFSLFVKPLETVFGWERSAITIGFTAFMLMLAFFSPFVGRAVDKFGARLVICAGAFMSALCYLSLITTRSPVQFYITHGIIGIFGACLGPISATFIVSALFEKNRGLAIGVTSMGIGVGAMVVAPLIGGYVIPHMGWKAGYLGNAFLIGIMLPLTFFILKPKFTRCIGTKIESDQPAQMSLPVKGVMFSLPFFLVSAGFFLNHFSLIGLIQNQFPFLQDAGFTAAVASSVVGVVGLFSAIGKFFFGWLCDKIKPKYAYAIGAGMTLLGLSILINLKPGSPALLKWLFGVVTGFGVGMWLPVLSMTVSTTFPLQFYGTCFGMVSLALNIGGALGPLAGAYLNDVTGNYRMTFLVIMASMLASTISLLTVRAEKETKTQLKETALSASC